jgi:hypothetical protein
MQSDALMDNRNRYRVKVSRINEDASFTIEARTVTLWPNNDLQIRGKNVG